MSVTLVRQLPIDPMKGTWYYFLDGDPTSGFAAAVDSLVLRVDSTGLGRVYKKTGAPDSGWTEITGGGSGSTPVATTVLTGTVEVDDNGAGAPVALTTTGHLLAADPHPQYALDSEKGAASGLATLDGSSLLTASQLPLGNSATTAAAGNDARLSDSRTPTAHGLNSAAGFHTASGLTTGWVLRATGATTFAMAALQASDIPTIAESQVTNLTTDLAARVLTSDARLSDSRTPTAHATTHQPGGSDAMAVDAVAATGSLRTLGTGAQQATSGTDARLSNARTPTAHATTHSSGGTDPVTLTNLAGYPGGTSTFLRADGSFASPPGALTPPYQLIHPDTITTSRTIAATERLLLLGTQTISPGTTVTVTPGAEFYILPPEPVPLTTDMLASGILPVARGGTGTDRGARGTTLLDFGPFPGQSDARVMVDGQPSILATSIVNAWLTPAATVDHSADEHVVESVQVVAGTIAPGTGFTVYGINMNSLNDPLGKGTRLYGRWSIAWSWN